MSMIGKSLHEIEIEIGRPITDEEFKTMVFNGTVRKIIIDGTSYVCDYEGR